MIINAMKLNQCIARSNIHLNDRKQIIALALARAIGYSLSLPTSAVDSPSKYFMENHQDAVDATLVNVNEICIINIQEASELTFKVWRMRYAIVYDSLAGNVINMLDCELEGGNASIPQIYTDLYAKIGSDNIKSFTNEVMLAMTTKEGI